MSASAYGMGDGDDFLVLLSPKAIPCPSLRIQKKKTGTEGQDALTEGHLYTLGGWEPLYAGPPPSTPREVRPPTRHKLVRASAFVSTSRRDCPR